MVAAAGIEPEAALFYLVNSNTCGAGQHFGSTLSSPPKVSILTKSIYLIIRSFYEKSKIQMNSYCATITLAGDDGYFVRLRWLNEINGFI